MNAIGGPDTDLHQTFVNQCDAFVFRTMVARHGPMVQRVCRSVLRDPHDADDAFQLTFMVLFRKAATITDTDSVGRWLCGVAYKTAARVRQRGVRRRVHERSWAHEPADDRAERDVEHDLFVLVREELERLPEKYRAPLVLCYFEGLTHEEAAKHLGWAAGTVKVRLVRGRKLLRERLDRRKIFLGAGLLLPLWKREAAAAPADALVDSTVAATRLAGARKAVLGKRLIPKSHRVVRFSGRAAGSMISLAWALFLALAMVWGIFRGVAVAQFTPHQNALPPDLPANLMDVLAIDCR
jgi:RNA polymerase sigma factor (sigma-70 family)